MHASNTDFPTMDDRFIWDIWLSSVQLPTVLAADELGIFDLLGRQPATADALARELGLNAQALVGVLPLLVGLGLLTHHLGRFGLTEAGRLYLRHDGPFYWGEALGVMRTPVVALLCDALRDPTERRHYQMAQDWTEGRIDKDAATAVARLMHAQSRPAALGLAATGAFAGVTRLLDVGGGSGCFSLALAKRHPTMRCTVMELPGMCEVVAGYVNEAGFGRQVASQAVDMFAEAWPRGHDAILLSNILHDWDPATNAQLLIEALRALPAGGRLFVHEMLLDDDGAGPLAAAAFSVMLLLATGGRQYSARELAAMLTEAGFTDVGVSPAYGYYALITARKP
ncbi:O-methyltransferase family 2 [Solidesulfovibrio fructosivorans JJ]]|uniref:O-methyltransferase family 2 n=1 Tax=Solidesulfovibrio fructosivorans JJ] TaxID=596151 RepID=E1JZB0_SOLFR|nr:methyltransferase [Solidesulfovibrio fructosivorans]EFL50270.1 O-methyltransferase family 2 [Solidesulfovibrio fructosivorans JJ]]